MVADDDTITFELYDDGRPFDPTLVDEVDVTLPANQRAVGGLGIHLIRHYMDTFSYERRGNQNVLTMTKDLKSGRKKIR